ncbi:MAG TPA: ribbon-helix-helix protein, CopG family [Deltaproteobacteria bacterium]|nr:ribbon-helix-helix protein, CopG family [Deltaproteobacteria bacterium]
MIRTQIQLTDEQARAIKKIAAAKGVSVAEVIRRAVEGVIRSDTRMGTEERQKRALDIVGKFGSGKRDVSKRHDAYLTDAYDK